MAKAIPKISTTQVQGQKETGFYRLPDVLKLIPISKSTWWSGIKRGEYPAGIKLSERTTAWRVEDIHALIEQLGEQEAA